MAQLAAEFQIGTAAKLRVLTTTSPPRIRAVQPLGRSRPVVFAAMVSGIDSDRPDGTFRPDG